MGILNASLALLRGLVDDIHVVRMTVFGNSTLAIPKNGKTELLIRDCAMSGFGRIWWDQWGVYSAARAAGDDWLILPKGFASFVRRPPLPLAAFVHDTMHAYYRRTHRRALGRSELAYFTRALRATLSQSDVVFVPTNFVASELASVAADMHTPLPRVVVIGEPVAIPFEEPIRVAGRRDIVVLTSSFPHKRSDTILGFIERWASTSSFDGSIHVVGPLSRVMRTPFAQRASNSRLSSQEYLHLLARSRVLVYMTEYEGFGLPPVEALYCGAAPVYSRIPATEEVMEGRGYAFDRDSFEEFAMSLEAALRVDERTLTTWRSDLASRFSAQQVAARVVSALGLPRATTTT